MHQVLPDVIGMPMKGREQMSAFGHAVWATMGPMNELFEEAMTGAEPLLDWANWACSRENLEPDSLGMEMYRAADRGELSEVEAHLLVLTMLSAGADTTVITMATAIRAFCQFPDQWKALQANPSKVRQAFDEALRWDFPSRMAGRIAMKDVQIEDITIPAGTRVGLLFAAANRDPRKWDDPERYDITRDLRGGLWHPLLRRPHPGPARDRRPDRRPAQEGSTASRRPAIRSGGSPPSATARPPCPSGLRRMRMAGPLCVLRGPLRGRLRMRESDGSTPATVLILRWRAARRASKDARPRSAA